MKIFQKTEGQGSTIVPSTPPCVGHVLFLFCVKCCPTFVTKFLAKVVNKWCGKLSTKVRTQICTLIILKFASVFFMHIYDFWLLSYTLSYKEFVFHTFEYFCKVWHTFHTFEKTWIFFQLFHCVTSPFYLHMPLPRQLLLNLKVHMCWPFLFLFCVKCCPMFVTKFRAKFLNKLWGKLFTKICTKMCTLII